MLLSLGLLLNGNKFNAYKQLQGFYPGLLKGRMSLSNSYSEFSGDETKCIAILITSTEGINLVEKLEKELPGC